MEKEESEASADWNKRRFCRRDGLSINLEGVRRIWEGKT